jgi:hypothetical protein
MERIFKFVGMSTVTAILLLVGAALTDSIHRPVTTTLAASPETKARASSEKEGQTRKEVVADLGDVKKAVGALQDHLVDGDVRGAHSDAKRLQSESRELSEVCDRWRVDLDRLAADGGKLFDEWTMLIDGIQEPTNRVRESERLSKARARFHENLEQANVALQEVQDVLVAYEDVEKIIRSAMEFAPNADNISKGLAELSISARQRTTAFRSATNAVIEAVRKLESSVI